ncbi:MAG: hypothetical protein R3250_01565, partial [Melioribacteraceae bacterium]|nr:hypothetical protein [Melioribacteraceae bacterium]
MKKILIISLVVFVNVGFLAQIDTENKLGSTKRFFAVGPNKPVVEYLSETASPVPDELEKVAVEVFFDMIPTMMRFSLPCYPSMVTENNIHFSNGWTETYDIKASSSCEILWDREAKYARMWIESQNPARIVVRFRAAIADPDGYIAHSDIPSGSPYGKGDWTDEWYYIYPDGVHTRHVRIYSGVAGQSMTVTDQTFGGIPPIREVPPSIVHEFQEDFVFGLPGHLPEDDIDVSAITLIHLDGTGKTFSYKPYPKGFGDFILAPIKIVNLKSEYKPFTISIPHGLENETYPPEGELPHIFQTWLKGEGGGYSSSLGHSLNWWHYRRTENILEQVYLSGMTDAKAPEDELIDLAKSWLDYPRVLMDGVELSYTETFYDPAQRAYVIPRKYVKNNQLNFRLGFPEEEDEYPIPISLFNPSFVIKNFGEKDFVLKINDKIMSDKKDFKFGYENT